MDFGATVTVLAMFAVAAVAVIATYRVKEKRAELQTQVQTKLIERFESAPELIEFLRSETGQEFISGVRVKQAASVSRRMLAGIRAAVFLAVLGLGFLVLWPLTREDGFIYPGVILLALGTGFFLASVVSMKMSRAWGLDQPSAAPHPSTQDVR